MSKIKIKVCNNNNMAQNLFDKNYFVIFGGGGIRGLSYLGAHKYFLENNFNLTGFAGSSIGAVFASLICAGYKPDELEKLVEETGFGELLGDFNIGFKKEIAFSKGNNFLEWIRERIEQKFYGEDYKKGKMPPVKFKDINKKLIIFSVDLNDFKLIEFSREKTPDFEVARAIRASVSMPGLFVPLEVDDKILVDGDLIKSTPLWRLSETIKNLDERIIEFRLEDTEKKSEITGTIDYINRVYNVICGFATDYLIDLYSEKDKFEYIKINTPNISVVDFLIPQEKRKELALIGYNSTKNYFEKDFIQKKSILNKKYEKLLQNVLNFQKEFLKRNVINCHVALCEMFCYLCCEKKYLDTKIYDLICNFKTDFDSCYHQDINFLGIRSAHIKNRNQLNNKLLEIVKVISQKSSGK